MKIPPFLLQVEPVQIDRSQVYRRSRRAGGWFVVDILSSRSIRLRRGADSVADGLGGTSDQLDLARNAGRPDCGFSDSAAYCWEGREAVRGKACGCC